MLRTSDLLSCAVITGFFGGTIPEGDPFGVEGEDCIHGPLVPSFAPEREGQGGDVVLESNGFEDREGVAWVPPVQNVQQASSGHGRAPEQEDHEEYSPAQRTD